MFEMCGNRSYLSTPGCRCGMTIVNLNKSRIADIRKYSFRPRAGWGVGVHQRRCSSTKQAVTSHECVSAGPPAVPFIPTPVALNAAAPTEATNATAIDTEATNATAVDTTAAAGAPAGVATLNELGYNSFLGTDYIPEKADPLVTVRAAPEYNICARLSTQSHRMSHTHASTCNPATA